MKTIAVYHNKGGVGKTTTVVNLAAALGKQGKKVLIIDLDSQANTTFAAGLVKFDDEVNDTLKEKNIVHLLISEEQFPIQEVARSANFCNPSVDVVPSHIDLMSEEDDLNRLDYSRMVLIQKLREVEHNYDIAIIDTPPSLNLYARIALIAADYLIIPSDLKPFANQGLNNVKSLIENVNGFRKIIGRQPIELLGVLATKISTNYKFQQATLPRRMQAVMERYKFNVMESIIFEREDLAKCSEATRIIGDMEIPDPLSVLDFNPQSESAKEFNMLAQEVIRKIG
ncbi:MAG: ParA family protein [Leptolyngbyaceae cyanobacterium]